MVPRFRSWTGSLLVAAILAAGACGGDGAEEPAEQTEAAAQAAPAAEQAEAEPPPDVQTGAPEVQAEETAPEVESDADRELLLYGESFAASVDEVDGARQFRFRGEADDLVRIAVDGKEGMDPIVALLEPNRTEIASNDDVSSANRDSLVVTRLPSAGLQVVRVTAFGDAIGAFVITIERLPEDPDDDSQVIAVGDTVAGTLGAPADVDIFEFAGEAGQEVVVRADGAVGVDTKIQIFDPDQLFLLIDDDGGHAVDAELRFQLPQSGAYRVEVFPVGSKVGPYQFSVRLRAAATEVDAAELEAMRNLALTYLDALQQGDALTLFALAGPEALEIWGWESAEDVSRDLGKLQSIGVDGDPGAVSSEIEGLLGRTTVVLEVAANAVDEQLRFDLINVDGRWLVDFVQRLFNPASAGG